MRPEHCPGCGLVLPDGPHGAQPFVDGINGAWDCYCVACDWSGDIMPDDEIGDDSPELGGTMGHSMVNGGAPSGLPRFHEILQELGELHERKNHDYAAGGKPTGNFDRRAALMRLYPGLVLDQSYKVAAFDILKQLDAALWMLTQRHESKTEEDVASRLRDVASYAIIAVALWEVRYETS